MTARYYKPPMFEHEQFFYCGNEKCFNIIAYLPEDIVKEAIENTLSFRYIVTCPVCNKANEVRKPSAAEFIKNSVGSIR